MPPALQPGFQERLADGRSELPAGQTEQRDQRDIVHLRRGDPDQDASDVTGRRSERVAIETSPNPRKVSVRCGEISK